MFKAKTVKLREKWHNDNKDTYPHSTNQKCMSETHIMIRAQRAVHKRRQKDSKSRREWKAPRKQCLLTTAGLMHIWMNSQRLWQSAQDLCKFKPDRVPVLGCGGWAQCPVIPTENLWQQLTKETSVSLQWILPEYSYPT